MFELFQRIPEPWRQLADLLIAPLAWIPRMQHTLWDFFFAPARGGSIAAKYLFLVFPALARGRGGLVHAALHLHAAVPLRARAVHPDDDADVVGRRPRRLAVLDRHVPLRRRGAGMGW